MDSILYLTSPRGVTTFPTRSKPSATTYNGANPKRRAGRIGTPAENGLSLAW